MPERVRLDTGDAMLQDSDGKPVRIWGDAATAAREGFAAVAEGDDRIVEVVPADELAGAVEMIRELREAGFAAVRATRTEADRERWADVSHRAHDLIEGGQSAPVEAVQCVDCGTELTETRAENAAEAAPRYGNQVLCGACRDASDLSARVLALDRAIRQHQVSLANGVELEDAERALAAAHAAAMGGR